MAKNRHACERCSHTRSASRMKISTHTGADRPARERNELVTFCGCLTDVQEFFRIVEHFQGVQNNQPVFKEIFVPLSLRKHLVKVTDASGAVLSLSPRWGQPFARDGMENLITTRSTAKRSAWQSLVKWSDPARR
jgi:hypothetical protein